ncbi:hypothetical protein N7468_008032 [Penicillium chermesinum]|uniref:Major facilitator superfamily (MFS) profile domain-containing protein n=1 Tax=Penicillium chermesinum TaxID=63820 RepID=A0A9W9TJG6_9EURO|nr:uncharacterized protein N7468_008032 [Penicillium chermesinum]KAJ5223490.1 hypothetical protein N7468_008032 [Penicillium chermesinum]
MEANNRSDLSPPPPLTNSNLGSSRTSLNEEEQEGHLGFPDGGWRAWGVVFGSWCAMVPSFGLMNTIGVFEAWLADHQLQDHSKASIGWIFSLYVFLLYFGSIQVGPIFDSHGLKPLLIPGCVGLVGSLMVFSVAEGCIAHWFLRRRALATGVAATAGGIGGIIFPVLVSNLAGRLGFPWAMRVIGFISAVFCALSVALLRTRASLLSPVQKGKIDIHSLGELRFALLTAAIVLIDFALLIPVTYLPSYAQSHGLGDSLAYNLSSILNAASIFGRIVPGYLADRFGRFNVMIITTFACSVITFGLWLPSRSNHAAILAYAVIFGFWSGSAISLAPVCVAQISKTEEFGRRYGTTYFLVSLGTLLAIPIAGELLKVRPPNGGLDNYYGLIVLCGLVYFCACLFFILSRAVSVGWGVKVF